MNIYQAICTEGYDVTSENLDLPFWELDRDMSHVTDQPGTIEEICHGLEVAMYKCIPKCGEYCPGFREQ